MLHLLRSQSRDSLRCTTDRIFSVYRAACRAPSLSDAAAQKGGQKSAAGPSLPPLGCPATWCVSIPCRPWRCWPQLTPCVLPQAPKKEAGEATVNAVLGPGAREGEHVFGVARILASFNDTFVYVPTQPRQRVAQGPKGRERWRRP
jgi:hypothetical protein